MTLLGDVSKTLEGVDAEISAAGTVKGSDRFFLLSAVENLAKAVVSRGLKRTI